MKAIIIISLLLIPAAFADVKWMYNEKEKSYYENIISSELPNTTVRIYPFLLRGKYCGFSYFSGVVALSTDSRCNFEYSALHEARHNYFWTLPYKVKVRFCNIYGYDSNIRDCWEAYAG